MVQVKQTLIIGWALMGSRKIISMNPYDNLESEQSRKEKDRHFMIDNRQCLCEHGGLNLMIARKGKYIPVNV